MNSTAWGKVNRESEEKERARERQSKGYKGCYKKEISANSVLACGNL